MKKYFIAMTSLIGTAALINAALPNSEADWCDIKDRKNNQVLHTYQGECGSQKFGGPWGDRALTIEEPNITKQKEEDDKKAALEQERLEQKARYDKLVEECDKETSAILLAVCDLLKNDPKLKKLSEKGK